MLFESEQTWIPFTMWCFVLSLVEICRVILEKIFLFFIFVSVFSLFRYYLPLEKGGPPFEQILILFTQECFMKSLRFSLIQGSFVPYLVEIGPNDSGEEDFLLNLLPRRHHLIPTMPTWFIKRIYVYSHFYNPNSKSKVKVPIRNYLEKYTLKFIFLI